MGEILNLLNRPVNDGYYRVQIRFEKEIAYHQLVDRIKKMGGQFAISPERTAKFGVFAAPDAAGKLRFLDSTQPIEEWDMPSGTKWQPGAAIAHMYNAVGSIPTADYMIIYMDVTNGAAGKPAPDGGQPVWTKINKNSKKI